MSRSPNKLGNNALLQLIAWLNAPRINEVEIGTGDVSSEEKLSQLRDSVVRELIEPLIEWLNMVTTYSHYRQNRKQRVGMVLTQATVNRMLRDCLVFPQLDPIKPGMQPSVSWIPDPRAAEGLSYIIKWQQAILYAFDRGWLSRLKRCAYEPCGRWFDTRDPRKQFHSTNCKKRSYDKSPQGKQRKRAYMKAYMRDYRKQNF